MGTILIAGSYGVGKSTLCEKLSQKMGIPFYSAGDIISKVNGEVYGANKAVSDKSGNQEILSEEINKILKIQPNILLAGHFCIFNKSNQVEHLPTEVFSNLHIESNLNKNSAKMILPIMSQYHTSLFPDSKLNTELEYIKNVPHRYALQKVYISWAFERNLKPGDLLLFYRMGDTFPKKYSSVITTVGVIDQVVDSFSGEEDFLSYCQNRSVFTTEELKRFWAQHRYNLKVLKFAYVKTLTKKITLDYLQQHGIVDAGQGPRPFTRITNEQFAMILRDSETTLYM